MNKQELQIVWNLINSMRATLEGIAGMLVDHVEADAEVEGCSHESTTPTTGFGTGPQEMCLDCSEIIPANERAN